MGYQQHPGDLWEGLEPTPEPPEENNNRTLLLIGGGVALLLGLGICLIAGFLVLRNRTGGGPEATIVAIVPTVEEPAGPPTTVVEQSTPPPGTNPTPTLVGAATVEVGVTEESPPTPTEATNVQVSGFAVRRFDAPPTINGNLDDWQGFETTQSQFQVFSATGWDGSNDIEAFWQVGWDNDALYIVVRVEDNIHVQTQTGNQIFKGDSVDMQIDMNVNAGARQVNSRTFQVTMSPGDFGAIPPSYYLFRANDAGAFLSNPAQGNVQVAATQTGNGYIVEARIPWSTLETTPTTGFVMGISLNVSDNDGPGSAVQEVMKAHVSTRTLQDPGTWGRMTLVD